MCTSEQGDHSIISGCLGHFIALAELTWSLEDTLGKLNGEAGGSNAQFKGLVAYGNLA